MQRHLINPQPHRRNLTRPLHKRRVAPLLPQTHLKLTAYRPVPKQVLELELQLED